VGAECRALPPSHNSRTYASTFGIATMAVRYANVYGSGQSPNRTQSAVAVFPNRDANKGRGSGHTFVGLREVVAKTFGREPVSEFVPARTYDVDSLVLDISELRSFIPFGPLPVDVGVRASWLGRSLKSRTM